MRKRLFVIIMVILLPAALKAQHIGVKTNLLYWMTTTPNLSVEFSMGKKFSLNLDGSYNPWEFKATETTNPKMKHWLASVEARYWFCEVFDGTFVGLQGIIGEYNIEDIPLIKWPEGSRYDGIAYGGGVTIGNHWALGRRWGFELSAGVGLLILDRTRYDQGTSGQEIDRKKFLYFGPTKLSVSFMYFFN